MALGTLKFIAVIFSLCVCVVLFLGGKGRMGVVCVFDAAPAAGKSSARERERERSRRGEALTVRESAKCCAPMHRQSSAADLFRPQAHALLSHPPSTQQATPGRPPPPPHSIIQPRSPFEF